MNAGAPSATTTSKAAAATSETTPVADSRELIVETHALSRHFGKLVAVSDVSLNVRAGEIYGVLGPNGAGKSTTIRMLCGILSPTSGSGRVVGHDIVREPERIKERIGYMTQRFSLYEDLTVQENLEFYAGIYSVPRSVRRKRLEALMEESGLGARRRQLTGTLSGGWKQRVALAAATVHEPRLLFLDEPTAGVDPVSRRDFWDRIHELSARGTTVIVTTHYMDEAERCHRLAFVFRGRVLATGRPEQVVAERGLTVVEIELPERERELGALLAVQPGVEEVSHWGHRLRLTTRGADGVALAQATLANTGARFGSLTRVRATVEDAFVSMVREDEGGGLSAPRPTQAGAA